MIIKIWWSLPFWRQDLRGYNRDIQEIIIRRRKRDRVRLTNCVMCSQKLCQGSKLIIEVLI